MKKLLSTKQFVKYLCLLLALAFTTPSALCAAEPQIVTPLENNDKMLFIGNSFSDWGGTLHGSIRTLIKASGTELNLSTTFIVRGLGELKHYVTEENLGVMAEIQKGGWKNVVIQGWQDAIFSQDTMSKYLKILDDEVVKSGSKTILYEPHVNSSTFVRDKEISNATYARLKNEVSVFHAPTVSAWDSVRVYHPDRFISLLYGADGGHQSDTGMALDAMTFYTILTQRSAETLKPTFGIRTSDPAMYEELARIGYNTGKDILKMNNSWIEDTQNPTAPTNLSASNKTSDRFVLTWAASTDDKGVLGYNIYRDNVLVGQATTPRFSVTGLSPETTYAIKVKAYDSEKKESPFSDVLSVTTEPFVVVDNKGDLMKWNFTGEQGKESVEASDIMTGISLTPPSSIIYKGPKFNISSWGADAFSMTGKHYSTLAEAVSNNEYFTFSIAPQEGNSISIENISFSMRTQNFEIHYTLMSSVTGFNVANALGTDNWNQENSWKPTNFDITGHDDIESPIEFRIYIHGDNDQHKNFSIDNLVITGGVKTIPLPPFPTELAVSNLTETGFTLKWKAAADAVSYKVFKDGDLVDTTNSLTLDIEGSIGETYSMTVIGIDSGDGETDESEPLAVTIPDLHAPTVPTGLTISEQDYYKFTLRWTSSTDNVAVTSYSVYTDGNFYGNTSDEGFMPMPFLTPGTSYKVQVKAFDAFGNESALSEPITATTLALPIPEELEATDVAENSFKLSWTLNADGIASHSFEVFKDGGLYNATTENAINITELLPYTTYNMTIRMVDNDGNKSEFSEVLPVKTLDNQAPTVPLNLRAENVTDISFKLLWDASDDNVEVESYDVHLDDIFYENTENTSFEFDNLTANTTYTVKVQAIDQAGNKSEFSEALPVTTRFDIAIEDAGNATKGIVIYPNPSKGIIVITSGDSDKTNNISIYNAAGMLLLSLGDVADGSEIDLSSYPAGSYIVKVKNNENTYTKTLIIER